MPTRATELEGLHGWTLHQFRNSMLTDDIAGPGMGVSRCRTWRDAEGWEMSSAVAAKPRLPRRATLSSRSKLVKSDTRGSNGISKGYDANADRSLPALAAWNEPEAMTEMLKAPHRDHGVIPPPSVLPIERGGPLRMPVITARRDRGRGRDAA